MNRRKFLKLCGLAACGAGFGFGATGCATIPKDVNWSDVPDSDFTIQKFDDWFKHYKLYNGINPNLELGKTGQGPTFIDSIAQGWSPGIDYSSSPMIAAADGVVVSVHNMDTGRLGGTAVYISHLGKNTISIMQYGPIDLDTRYVHLGAVYVERRQKVKRGDLIGNVEFYGHGKLMVNMFGNLVDPDNYGERHTYMKYYEGVNTAQVDDPFNKHSKQADICRELLSYASPHLRLSMEKFRNDPHFKEINHPKRGTRYVNWDYIEILRYLDELFKARPDHFSRLSLEKFAEHKKGFYSSQPIILTLPIKA